MLSSTLEISAPLASAIDIHSHFLLKSWANYARAFGGHSWPWLRHDGEKPSGTYGYGKPCSAMLMVDDTAFRPVTAACWDVRTRLQDLNAAGVKEQVVSQTPLLFQWQRDARTAAAIARDFNDAAIEMVHSRECEGRLHTLCQVPLQDVDLACQEVSRAKKLGHVGVQIGNHVNSKDLDDDELVAFLQHCAAEDFPVLVHPWDMSSIGPGNRSGEYMMDWTVGMPMETHLSITRMILGGAFDRLPECLKICFCHGGGAFPALLGRLDNAWRERSVARGKAQRPPSEYMGRFYVDSAVFDPHVLRLLIDTFGPDRVMLGSDYPFPLGEQRIGHLVRTAPDLLEDEREAILFRNARGFLSLPEPQSQKVEVLRLLPEEKSSQWFDEDFSAVPAYRPELGKTWFDEDFEALDFPVPEQFLQAGSHPFAGQLRGTLRVAQTALESLKAHVWGNTEVMAACSYIGLRGDTPLFQAPTSDPPAVGRRRVMNFVGGAAQWPSSGLPLVDPSRGEIYGEVAKSSEQDVHEAVQVAKKAGPSWAETPLESRCALVSKLATALEEATEDFASAESLDTGKPLALARALDIPRSVANLRFFASFSQHLGGDLREIQGGPAESMSYFVRKPLGVVGIITPWNLPLYLLTWKLAPALVMGNSVVAKPSELTPTTASMLGELATKVGLPDGVFNVVHGDGAIAGEALARHPDIAGVSFTGGTSTGALVAAAAAPGFKKLSLELGGKNAAIVFEDCSFEEAVDGVVRSSFLNSGQICLCSSRLLVQQRPESDFFSRFTMALVNATKRLIVGPPEDPTTDVGPLVSKAHLEKVSTAVKTAQAEGGTVLCGGAPPKIALASRGFFYKPTVISGLPMSSKTAQEEIFGPVVTVHPFRDAAEAVAMANETSYGLSASVWTESLKNAEVAEKLRAGTVWINTWLSRELHMPFGGMGKSGVNREGGAHSLDFFSEITTVSQKRGCRTPPSMPGGFSRAKNSVVESPILGHRACFSTSPRSPPVPLGRYVHARRANGLVFTAGIGPRHPITDEIPGGPITDPATNESQEYDLAAQARQCFANLRLTLADAGCSLQDVIDIQVFLVNMKRDFASFNLVWAEEMAGINATRTTIGVTDLPPGGRIAVEFRAIARAPVKVE